MYSEEENLGNNKKCKAMYHLFTYLRYGHLGKANRIPIPIYIIENTRKIFPSPDDNCIFAFCFHGRCLHQQPLSIYIKFSHGGYKRILMVKISKTFWMKSHATSQNRFLTTTQFTDRVYTSDTVQQFH
jgi:hypothetical protein